MKELPKAYTPQKTEDRIYQLWEKSGFFNPDILVKKGGCKEKCQTIFHCFASPQRDRYLAHGARCHACGRRYSHSLP